MIRRSIRPSLAAVTALALLVLATWLYERLPTEEERQAPLTTEGRVGEQVGTTGFTVRVRKVRLARSVAGRYPDLGDEPITTSGIFVIVYATVTSLEKPIQLDYAELRTADGLSYQATARLDLGIKNEAALQALFPTPRVFAFEVPPAKLVGARLVTGHWYAPFIRVYVPEVSIDLGLTARTTPTLLAGAPHDYKVRVPQ
ncbi:MAG TPA: hypothetical protein VIR33_12540 [Thermopolyspora sp.]|jgi:hypothetical protein